MIVVTILLYHLKLILKCVRMCQPLHACAHSLMHSDTHACMPTHTKWINGISIFWVEKHHWICININKLKKICRKMLCMLHILKVQEILSEGEMDCHTKHLPDHLTQSHNSTSCWFSFTSQPLTLDNSPFETNFPWLTSLKSSLL